MEETGKIPVAIFVRVSSKRQDYQRQISDLEKYAERQAYQVVQIFKEVISASKTDTGNRPVITDLLEYVKSGKIKKVLVTEVSRLGRKPSQILHLMEQLTDLKVSIYAQNFGMETLLPNGKRNPAASMIFIAFADMALSEVEFLSSRIISGQDEARRQGKKIGRVPGSIEKTEDLLKKYPSVLKYLKQENYSIREISKLTKISINTVRKVKAALDKNKIE